MIAQINNLKPTRPTTAGRDRWRFDVAADVLGETIWIPGWVYLPHAKEGYRVNPPRSGHFRLVKGVSQSLCARVEKLVEGKLVRLGVDGPVDVAEEVGEPDAREDEEWLGDD